MSKYLALWIKVVPQIKKGVSGCKALLKDFFKVELCCLVVRNFTEVPPWNNILGICQQPGMLMCKIVKNTKQGGAKPGRYGSGPEGYIERLNRKFARDSAKGPAREHRDLKES